MEDSKIKMFLKHPGAVYFYVCRTILSLVNITFVSLHDDVM